MTSNNSKMLSSDILAKFRDCGDEIRVCSLSYVAYSVADEVACNATKEASNTVVFSNTDQYEHFAESVKTKEGGIPPHFSL